MNAIRPISSHLAAQRDVRGIIRRHWWLMGLFVVVGLVGGWQFTKTQPRVYESSTAVLVLPTGSGQDTNVVGGRTKGDLNLDTEAQLVHSTAVATAAAALLRSTSPAGPLAQPDTLAMDVTVEVPANTSVLVISYQAGDPHRAQAGSHAFAEAYLSNRADTDKAELASRIATLDGKLKELNATLTQINARLVTLRPESAERANLESQRQTTTSQINGLTAQFNQVTETPVSAGRILRDAELPTRPTTPSTPINLASGALLGLLVGIGAALLRDRLGRRVRRTADLARRTDVTILADVPRRLRPLRDDVFPPSGPGATVFNRIRNEILASIPPPPAVPHTRALAHGQVIVVAGTSRGPAATLVAANLAAALARTGAETVLICGHVLDGNAGTVPAATLLDVPAEPGLADIVAGRVELAAALARSPRQAHLRVLTTGGTAGDGVLQSQSLRDVVGAVRGRASYIVIAAPPTATGADAQSLASLADAAVLTVELRRTRYAEVADAAEQLRGVGATVVGAVVLRRLRRARRQTGRPAGNGATRRAEAASHRAEVAARLANEAAHQDRPEAVNPVPDPAGSPDVDLDLDQPRRYPAPVIRTPSRRPTPRPMPASVPASLPTEDADPAENGGW